MSENIKNHIPVYRNVFIALLFFTALTVGVSFINFNLVWLGIFIGLLIACIKGYLVAANFMHLNNEKSFIYGILLLTVAFFFVLLFIPLSWDINGHDVKTDRNNAFDEFKIIDDSQENHHDEH